MKARLPEIFTALPTTEPRFNLLGNFPQPAAGASLSLLAHNFFHQSDHLGGLDHHFFGQVL
jgi:hypothetical protein